MEWLWEKDKFVNRVYLMRELYEKYLEGSLEPSIFDTEADPFVDPNDSFCVPSEDDYAIYHDSQQTGIMHVKVEPCKPDGGVINDDEDEGNPFDMVEQPQDLLGKRLDVLVTVSSCKGLQKKVHTRDSPKFSL